MALPKPRRPSWRGYPYPGPPARKCPNCGEISHFVNVCPNCGHRISETGVDITQLQLFGILFGGFIVFVLTFAILGFLAVIPAVIFILIGIYALGKEIDKNISRTYQMGERKNISNTYQRKRRKV